GSEFISEFRPIQHDILIVHKNIEGSIRSFGSQAQRMPIDIMPLNTDFNKTAVLDSCTDLWHKALLRPEWSENFCIASVSLLCKQSIPTGKNNNQGNASHESTTDTHSNAR